jgi:molybdopterin synthase sulfurtransferase
MKEIEEIDTYDLARILNTGDCTLIDVRPSEAYNGWRMMDESRGGHLPGSRSVPLKWFDYIDLPDMLVSKNLSFDSPLIIYGYENQDLFRAGRILRRIGCRKVLSYSGFRTEWVADRSLPLDRLCRYDKLVPAGWLRSLIEEGTAAGVGSDGHVVCHCHYRNREDYVRGHLPTAIELDTNSLESAETWNRRSPEELRQTLAGKGITADTTVIVYGRFSNPRNEDPFPGSSEGQLGAMRCAFIMLYAGVKDVRVLNGGLQAWTDAGFGLATGPVASRLVEDFKGEIPLHPEFAVDIEEAKKLLAAEDANLVCVRSWPELIGEVSGYNYIEKKGRIPGAVFGNCGSDAYHMENYRNLDHTCREYHEVAEMWAAAGITPDKHNAFYCGTGWRGSEAFFNAWLMGWPRISVFDGGWFEWSNDDANPYETGVPAGMKIIGRVYEQ